MADVYEDGVQRVLRLMKDTFGDTFTAYFNGELLNVTEEYLPCIMVTSPQAQVDSDATGTDMVTETIVVIVVLNKKDDIGGSPDTNLTDLKVRQFVYGQDPTTANYLPKTVMYAVRKHITMQSDTLEQDIQIDFTPNNRGLTDNIATQEGYVTITMKRLIIVPSRD